MLGELLAGFAKGNRNEQNRRELQQFLSSPRVIILPINQQTAEHYAKVYLELKQKGIPIPTNDMWICASALQHKLSVFTYDKHFERVSELIVVKTLTDL